MNFCIIMQTNVVDRLKQAMEENDPNQSFVICDKSKSDFFKILNSELNSELNEDDEDDEDDEEKVCDCCKCRPPTQYLTET